LSRRREFLVSSAVSRLADLIVEVTASNTDVKTLATWARIASVSPSALRGYCRVAGVRPKAALDFARLLCLVVKMRDEWVPSAWLDISDERNLQRLLGRGGLQKNGDPPQLIDFLQGQRLLSESAYLVQAIAERVRCLPQPEASRSSWVNRTESHGG
jgi:hypothetical protein